ncbi:MAG TPA: TolC family protein [Bryobacteraceae bacterium]|jgi:outer membrane protein|nr:TolC family protein [Bryobacteraceae bacterium]
MPFRIPKPLFIFVLVGFVAVGQAPPKLTLQEAVAIAIKNHPQIQGAQNEANFAQQQVTINRAAYYPTLNGDVTASQGNDLSRIGAGALSASRLFDRFGAGAIVDQLVTDSGRTPNLVASARFQAQAAAHSLEATRYDVVLQVNRAYFEVLHAQAVIKTAQQTIEARQTLSDQVTELAKNNLKSQLDVSFADVNVSEAKLLLIRAQEALQGSVAELGRALGSDQPANFQLVEEPIPTGPPATADDLIAQAVANRPELASLRSSRDSAYKFFEAERDLKRPSVTIEAVGGFVPYINTPPTAPIPANYEAIAANVHIPVFNGHLFSARREAAHQRAMESDQRLRNQQQIVARDVRVAYGGAITAYQRIDVTAQFLRQAALALDLARGRYQLGLSSIVELTQAELNLTQAEIENLSAKYDYQSQYAELQYTIGALR